MGNDTLGYTGVLLQYRSGSNLLEGIAEKSEGVSEKENADK